MSFKVKVLRLVIVPLFLGGLISCSSFAKLGNALSNQNNLPLTNIAQIAQEQQETTIYLKGIVSSQAPFVGGGAYQLKDATGTIWVISQGKLPNIGEEVAIEGKLAYQSIPIGSQEMGEFYVLEVQPVEATRLVDKSSLITPETNSQATNTQDNPEVKVNISENRENNQQEPLQAINNQNNSNNNSELPQITSSETKTQANPTSAVISNTNLTQPQDLATSQGTNNNKQPQTVEIKPNNPQIATTSDPISVPAIVPEKPPAAIAPTRPKPTLDLPFLPHKEYKKQ